MKKSFSWRVFISFGLTISFFVLLVSGVVLYIAPPGRVANWMDWRMVGLTKGAWQDQHIIFGFAFIVLSVFHLFVINWKAFFSYLRRTAAGTGLKNPMELFGSLLLSVVFATGTFLALQPFSGVIDFGTSLSQSWEKKESRPPVPHAETMSLVELSRQPGLGGDPALLKTKLEAAGYRIDSLEQTLADIALRNRTAAENVYRHIDPGEKADTSLGGKGLGEKTLRQIAGENSVSPDAVQMALRQQGVDAEPSMTLKSIAKKNGMQIQELKQLLETMLEP